MRSKVLLLVLVCLTVSLLAGAAASQNQLPPDGYDQIGLYTEPDFNGPNAVFMEATVGSLIEDVYIVMSGVTAASVAGFECRLTFAGGSPVTNVTFPVGAVNIGYIPEEIIVGFATPVLAVDGVAHIGTVDFLLIAPQEWITLGPVSVPSYPGQIVYVDGEDFNNLIPMYPSSGGFDLPVFAVNATDVVATEDVSWSGVKALFR